MLMLGYRDPGYADSLSAYGTPRRLAHSGGWILERSIPGTPHQDGMGLYPMLSCEDWAGLAVDLEALREEGFVSLVCVSDPFLEAPGCDPFLGFDTTRPFKIHYAAHLDRPVDQIVSRHHAVHARKAARNLEVEVAEEPLTYLDEWHDLYSMLIARHGIRDLRRFSKESFRKLLGVPGVCLMRALHDGTAVGAQVFVQQGDVVHAHLAAFSPAGYGHGASYLLDWQALNYFTGKARVLNWGGGVAASPEDGLKDYKRGWSTHEYTSFLHGAVLDPGRYANLSGVEFPGFAGYFPAYRRGEFG
jgi:hypothetical protein